MNALWPIINALQVLAISAWTVLWTTISMVLSIVTFNSNLALIFARRVYAPPLLKVLAADFRPEPLPALDWDKPHIFVMNHESAADILCAFKGLPVNLRFIAKHSLKYIPFLGWYMAFTKMVFVNRSSRADAMKSLQAAGERIRGGANIIAFPEGTRSPTRQILPFKKGVFLVALEAQVPIVPVAISGSGVVAPATSFKFRPAQIRMKVGKPISTAGRTQADRDALIAEVRAAIIELHKEIGGKGGIDEVEALPAARDSA